MPADSLEDFASLDVPWWGWVMFLAGLGALLLFDLLVVHRRAEEPALRRSVVESLAWISLGLGFSVVIWGMGGAQATGEYLSGYLIEKSLSVDNVFVWSVILAHFAVPRAYQHRVLFWGVFGALALRGAFVFGGIALLDGLEWTAYLFGVVLLVTAVRLLGGNDEVDPGRSRSLRFFGRLIPSTDHYDGQRLFTVENGRRLATPLLFVLIVIETTDLVFAVDSIPAILSVARDPFIVLTSNAFAILGLRALYFLFAYVQGRFRYLPQGIAVVLAFVGAKMILEQGIPGTGERWHPPAWVSLVTIAGILATAVAASVLRPAD